MKEAMEIHDQFLDKRGPVGTAHRCFPLPFNEKLRRKKKFRFIFLTKYVLTSQTNEFYHHREARNAPKVRMKSKIKQLVEPFSDIVPGKVGNICKTSQGHKKLFQC